MSRTMSSWPKSRLFQLSQSTLICRHTRDTVDFEMAPRKIAVRARPTRRVLVPAKYAPAISASTSRVRRRYAGKVLLTHSVVRWRQHSDARAAPPP
jgi:hypothetical protein